jgi:hypothetical protein
MSNSPYQQRLSPYLDLLRTDNSLLSPYHTFVQPQQQLQQRLQQQSLHIGHLEKSVIGSSPRLRAGNNRHSTGGGGHFFNFSHFYRSQVPLRP